MDAVRLGLIYRALRRRKGWTQETLAGEARVSRGAVQRIERGEADAFTGDHLRRIAVALGARFEQRLLWQGEALDRLLDEGHARLVERVIRWLHAEGWEVVPEATFAVGSERGSIDILAWHAETRTLLVIEVKTVVPDMQGLLAGVDRKARVAPSIARSRGWRATAVGRLVVLPDDRTSRRRVAQHAATLEAALPARTREVKRWVRHPSGAIAGIAFLPDDRGVGARHRAPSVAAAPRA
jgi:transcriptional regulator with XRE-family HTH domain